MSCGQAGTLPYLMLGVMDVKSGASCPNLLQFLLTVYDQSLLLYFGSLLPLNLYIQLYIAVSGTRFSFSWMFVFTFS